MNELQVFQNPKFGNVRTITESGKTLFCGSDVAKALGYKSPKDAISAHCKGAVKRRTLTNGGEQEMNFIPEGDIYRLAAKSELPGADEFESWIFDEVLPAIRKTGTYRAGKGIPEAQRAVLAEAKLNNSLARLASVWMKIAKENPIPEYKQVCVHYASSVLAGKEVLPLPPVGEQTYTASEVGAMLGGISANKVGRIANEHHLKTPEYGVEVWDKSPHSSKQVPSWRYNAKAVLRMREVLGVSQ